ERFDLYELENNRIGDAESILLLEKNIEDVCREMDLFGRDNEALLEEILGLTIKDLLINQLILESNRDELDSVAQLTYNEFVVPATLVPERETELDNLLLFAREKIGLDKAADLSGRIQAVEAKFP